MCGQLEPYYYLLITLVKLHQLELHLKLLVRHMVHVQVIHWQKLVLQMVVLHVHHSNNLMKLEDMLKDQNKLLEVLAVHIIIMIILVKTISMIQCLCIVMLQQVIQKMLRENSHHLITMYLVVIYKIFILMVNIIMILVKLKHII